VIDTAGRLALDPATVALFPDRRVRITPDGDGIRVDRP
jgi:hypothetical protein